MGILKVACPGCAAVLKSKNPDGWAAGTRMTCPKCQTTIVAGDAVPSPRPVKAVAAEAPRPKTKPRPVEDDQDEDDRPARKKGKKAKPVGLSPAVYWSLRGVVLVVLLAVLGVGVVMFQNRQAENRATEAENERIRQKNAQIAAEEGKP